MEKIVFESPIYNDEYEMLIYRSDIIRVIPHQLYRFVISLKSCKGPSKITPTLTLPLKKGNLKVGNENYNYMVSTYNSKENPICVVDVLSETGIVDISYHCENMDYRNRPYWGSSKILRPLGMIKEDISPSKVIYHCTDMKSGLFDSYIFILEWFVVRE